jgi:hypothetical protein
VEQSEEVKAKAGLGLVRREGGGECRVLQIHVCPAGALRRDTTQVRRQQPAQAGRYQSQEHHHLNSVSLYPSKMPGVA